mgnify:CR=1 FL=1
MDALAQNLTGVIVEMALKMGLSRAPLSLNYPCASLARMLGVPAGPQAVKAALDAFFAARTGLFGAVQVEAHEDGFCLTIPAEGVARVVSQAPAAAFLRDSGQAVQDKIGQSCPAQGIVAFQIQKGSAGGLSPPFVPCACRTR